MSTDQTTLNQQIAQGNTSTIPEANRVSTTTPRPPRKSADEFPPLEPGLLYQRWLICNGQRTSGGCFTVESNGSGTYIFPPSEPLESFQALGIMPQPQGGSAVPTPPPIVRGEL